jgi:hypothetical protein
MGGISYQIWIGGLMDAPSFSLGPIPTLQDGPLMESSRGTRGGPGHLPFFPSLGHMQYRSLLRGPCRGG